MRQFVSNIAVFLPNIIWIGLQLGKLSQKLKKGERFIETQCSFRFVIRVHQEVCTCRIVSLYVQRICATMVNTHTHTNRHTDTQLLTGFVLLSDASELILIHVNNLNFLRLSDVELKKAWCHSRTLWTDKEKCLVHPYITTQTNFQLFRWYTLSQTFLRIFLALQEAKYCPCSKMSDGCNRTGVSRGYRSSVSDSNRPINNDAAM